MHITHGGIHPHPHHVCAASRNLECAPFRRSPDNPEDRPTLNPDAVEFRFGLTRLACTRTFIIMRFARIVSCQTAINCGRGGGRAACVQAGRFWLKRRRGMDVGCVQMQKPEVAPFPRSRHAMRISNCESKIAPASSARICPPARTPHARPHDRN